MSAAAGERWWRRHARAVRVLAGCLIGVIAIAVVLRIRSEAHDSRGVWSELRHANGRLLVCAGLLEIVSYLLPGVILRRLLAELTPGDAYRVALASLGVGPLLPGNPVSGSGLAYAELRRLGVPSRRAGASSLALVVGIPAAAMALLAGPTLIASGIAAPLPAGWRGVVLVLGAMAVVLGLAIVGGVARGPGAGRAGRAVAAIGGRRGASLVLVLGALAAASDAGCLWMTGRALHVHLPLASLPMAYVAGVAIMSLPVLPDGLGAVEVSLPAIFAAAGAVYASAVTVVLAWRVLSFWLPTLAGGLALASLHRLRPATVETG